ncbi:hypothetical protein Tco_0319915 [Tanacetum coccineum]
MVIFLRVVPSYTSIRDPLRRLCDRLIAVSISGRGQAPKKVTATDLFYLRRLDEGMVVNVPFLLAQYLFRYAKGRKRVARVIEMDELVRLRICERLGDIWAWVAPGPERQLVATAGAAQVDLDVAEEGAQAIPSPIQAPQTLPAAASVVRTMP